MYNITEIKNYLKENLSEFRYTHVLLVADEALKLAKVYNESEEKAYVAGLLHDIAKELEESDFKELVKKYNIDKKWLEKENFPIIHSLVGAEIVKEKYTSDEDIYYAIKYHTIGNVYMNNLAKIIFIADKIARTNLTLELKEVKTIAYKDLDKSIKLFIISEKKHLESLNKSLHKDTLKMLEIL